MAKTGLKPISEQIRLAMIGDGAAFTQLWDTYIEMLRTYLKTEMKLSDAFLVDDICSRSFEKAFRQISSYNPALSQFSTWLRRIAHNTALDLLQQEFRNSGKYISLDEESESPSIDIKDDVDTPLESIIKDEDESLTLKYIEALPELYREVARKRLVEGLQYKEIADELKMELNTVRTRIRRAREIIAKMEDEI